MTIEEQKKATDIAYKELIRWTKSGHVMCEKCRYTYKQNRIFAIRMAEGVVVLVEANSPMDAIRKTYISILEFENDWKDSRDMEQRPDGKFYVERDDKNIIPV